ncbi:MAG: sensor domain-containing protein [Mycobacterium sp.]|nr:sensor domain-containing protein [Mycobacterium sp.]
MSRRPAITALLCMTGLAPLVGACATTTAGTAMPAAAPTTATAENLGNLLLPAADVSAALSAKNMVVTRDVTALWFDSTHVAEGVGCLAVGGAAQRGVYADSGWTAVHGQVLRDPPTTPLWSQFATQAVVLFESERAAGDFFTRSRDVWASCSDRELTYEQQLAPAQQWSIGPVGVDGGVLTVAREQRSPERWSCQRALAVQGQVVVDVEACALDSPNPTTAATSLARSIADRIGPA